MKELWILAAVFFTLTVNAQQHYETSKIKDNVKTTYTFIIPAGWDVSYSIAKKYNAEIAYLHSADSYRSPKATIHINHVPFDRHDEAMEDIIDYDMEGYLEFSDVMVSNNKKITIDGGKSLAIIKHIRGASDADFMAIAYIPEAENITTVTLVSNNDGNFYESLKVFEEIVLSYQKRTEHLAVITKNSYY